MKKNILGIYIDRDSFQYAAAVKGISGYRLKRPGLGYRACGTDKGNGYALLKKFLKEVPPDRSRSVYLALPRSQIFAREIRLPVMPLEDALMSVQNSLAIYAHLAPETIYYDIYVARHDKDGIHMLLFYAAKNEIEKINKIFSDTGHTASLKGILPVSYGIFALADKGIASPYTGVCLHQEDVAEFFVFSKNGLLFTMTAPLYEDEKALLKKGVVKRFPGIDKSFFDFNAIGGCDISRNCPQHFKFLPDLQENLASAAIAPALTKVQPVSVDEQPVRIKFIHPVRYIVPFICILVLGLYILTGNVEKKADQAESEFQELKNTVTQLENKLAPLQKKIDTLKKAASFKQDVKKIVQSKPMMYSAINEIARLVPEGTWFAGFSYHDGKILLRGRGSDALGTVELLRSSDMFVNVGLKGSVNRSSTGDERFSISLELKQE
ncbi:MAG: hypothetical protein U9P10_01340 [Thermodesulfobacteriota bacterium]|nr:hypothetical protein [Thermodesulfobacteriota bacterium]